jgi:hypothetical protein
VQYSRRWHSSSGEPNASRQRWLAAVYNAASAAVHAPANPPPLPSDAGLRERRRPNINPTLRLTGPHFFSSLTHSPTTSTSLRLTRPPRAFSSSEHHQSILDRSTLQHLVKMKYSLALVAAASAMVAAQDISSLPECGVSHWSH